MSSSEGCSLVKGFLKYAGCKQIALKKKLKVENFGGNLLESGWWCVVL